MYKQGDIVETVKNITTGYGEEKEIIIPIHTKVRFLKVLHNENDLSECKAAIQKIEDSEDFLIVKETDIKPIDDKIIEKTSTQIADNLYKENPRLRIYHYNVIKRYYYKAYYIIVGIKEILRNKIINILGGKVE